MKKLLSSAAAASAAILASGLSLVAADWPNWRGPNHDGQSAETGLDLDWSDGEPTLLWQSKGCGKGYSSVAVANGRVFTMGARDGEEHLVAFSEKDGQELGATAFGTSKGSNGTPTVDGNLVYGIGRHGDLVCCRVDTGEVVWQKRFDRDFDGKMMSGWGFSESPRIDGDWLLCTPGSPDALMVALDKHTGELIWKTEVPEEALGKRGKDGAGYATIVITEAGGTKQYVQLTGRGLIGVRASDGKFLWTYNPVANGTANISTPLATPDGIFASTGYGTGSARVKLLPKDGKVAVEEVYFLDKGTLENHHGGMVLIDGHVYAGHKHNNGFPICIDVETGEVAWGGDFRGPGTGSAAITAAAGHLIFRYQDGVVASIAADPSEYRLTGSFTPAYQQGKSWAHPVVANGKLYLREQDVLMCYDLGGS